MRLSPVGSFPCLPSPKVPQVAATEECTKQGQPPHPNPVPSGLPGLHAANLGFAGGLNYRLFVHSL